MAGDPVDTNPGLYRVVMENDRVRVLEYIDKPGDKTTPHRHPESVMLTLNSFRRRLVSGEQQRDVEMEAGETTWLPAQEHYGQNTGETETHVIFVELKEPAGTEPMDRGEAQLGPQSG
jgi:quercetin dioxygenase-like cupin family protein